LALISVAYFLPSFRKQQSDDAAGTAARYTRANPPERLLAQFACKDRSVASRMEAGIKKLSAAAKAELAGLSTGAVRKLLRT